MLFLKILFVVSALSGILLLLLNRKPKEKKDTDNDFVTADINILFPVEKIFNGIIYLNGECLLIAKIEGVNFSVMSENEQNARESVLVDIFARIDYPVKFLTNTVVADTTAEATRIAQMAANTEEQSLQEYRTLYAGALQLMRTEREIIYQESYMVIPGSTEEEAISRLNIIKSALSNTSVILTPITTTDEVFNSIQNILLPEKIIKPADVAREGVTSKFHFNWRETTNV